MVGTRFAEADVPPTHVLAATDADDVSIGPDTNGISDDVFLSMLHQQENAASSYRTSTLADEQANALEFYDAQPFGDEVDGQSQIVTPYVAEVVDYMTISIARTCASSDRVVEFEAKLPGQEDAAAEATEAVSDSFMRKQDGYKIIVGWIQSGLIEKIGIVKTAAVTKTRLRRSLVRADEDQLAMLDMEGSLKDYSEHPEGGFHARVQHKEEHRQYIDMTVPSEEFLFSAWARHEDEAHYIAQRSRKTRSDLIEMGFARDVVDGLSDDPTSPWFDDPRAIARWGDDANLIARDDTAYEVVLLEEYIRADRDGDGIAELVQVFRVGDTILDEQEVDEQPFVLFCPFPRAHRMVGDSLAEKVMDLQRLRSVTTRQTIDGMALSNRPRSWIDQSAIGPTTIDDWLTPGPGVLVRGQNGAQGVPQPIGDGFDISAGLSMLQFLAGEGESRTGITRLNQGLDADTLNRTATGTALMQASGQQMEEYAARNFAEAFGRLMAKKMRLMIADGDPMMLKIDGEFKEANPAAWDGDMPVKVKVGLGSGNKGQRLQNWQLVVADQMALKQGGSPLVTDENMYRVRDGAIRDMGLGMPSEFYTDPSTLPPTPPQPPQPSPEAIKAQGDAQAAQQKLANQHELAVAEAQRKAQEAEADAQLRAVQGQADAELAHAKAEADALLARDKAASEHELAIRRQDAEMMLAVRQWEHERDLKDERHKQEMQHAVGKLRPGGALDE